MVVLTLTIAAAAFYFYKEYNRKNKDTAGLKPAYTIAASLLIKEFETDEFSAGKKYSGKIISTGGIVKDVIKDDQGFYSVILGDTSSMSSVRCSLDSTHNNEAIELQKRVHATVKGVCAGYTTDELLGSDVILVRCVIDSNK